MGLEDALCDFCCMEVVDPLNELVAVETDDGGYITLCERCIATEAEQQKVTPMEASLRDLVNRIKEVDG